jgi:hypothetical protein
MLGEHAQFADGSVSVEAGIADMLVRMEGEIAELVEDDEVHTGQMIGEPALPCVTSPGLEPVD